MKKNIAFIHYSYPPVIGGVEFIMQGHARVFAKKGHKVKVITARGESSTEGVELTLLPFLSTDDPQIDAMQKTLSRGEVPEQFHEVKEKIKQQLKTELADQQVCFIHNVMTMHFNLMLTAALAELIKEKELKTVFYNWIHDASIINPHYTFTRPDEYPWNLVKTYLPEARTVAISRLRQRQIAELFAVSEQKITMVPDGIDVKSFLNISDVLWNIFIKHKLFTRDIVAFFPSRILRRKNYELAIGIIKKLQDNAINSVLLLTGPPDPHNPETRHYLNELKELCSELHLEKDVLFLYDVLKENNEDRGVDYRMIKNLYVLSDILLLTSSQEGFGIPLLEAASCKTPIACSSIEPLNEIDPEHMLLFDLDENPEEIALRIHSFLQKQDRYHLFKTLTGTYTWEAIFTNHLKHMVE